MPAKPKLIVELKDKLHPRNRHKYRYNFPELITSFPDLAAFVSLNPFQDLSIDFKNPQAVKMLNKALLKHFYNIAFWDIPEGYLCPPVPGRADYIHYLADLLASSNKEIIPRGKSVKVLDVGVGANCIYPLIGHQEYGWNFTGSDIDPVAISSAKNMVQANSLTKAISIRKQNSTKHVFTGIILPKETFDLTMCNPPFHASLTEATAGTVRKWKNLGKAEQGIVTLNFGGRNTELWCEGGEERFVRQMIEESAAFAKSCFWFTSLISKKETLPGCYRALEKFKAGEVRTINMAQGQKTSRILAWTFLDQAEQQEWQSKHRK
ncbi:23S rRNA (adenine(1618)-N(6))-methyltransferase RlmF [Mucilaginibacter arboris]|uniref:Ribosomal RNA large subunit methyltransferase F n=1 Tax=Mucilaginibacter arboris TaxID=2682090 RepID=A0A7K1T0I2_9SPHI|nr:23S rRNA (adenine(1618)-N(6))-methyltransferase RlmF [Mucilaginibacter arboris]MVN23063.1 23S rRNA (adenine(1618)-N(6))-methyltransferase RlmF [Mucilaginibacter arboris]